MAVAHRIGRESIECSPTILSLLVRCRRSCCRRTLLQGEAYGCGVVPLFPADVRAPIRRCGMCKRGVVGADVGTRPLTFDTITATSQHSGGRTGGRDVLNIDGGVVPYAAGCSVFLCVLLLRGICFRATALVGPVGLYPVRAPTVPFSPDAHVYVCREASVTRAWVTEEPYTGAEHAEHCFACASRQQEQ